MFQNQRVETNNCISQFTDLYGVSVSVPGHHDNRRGIILQQHRTRARMVQSMLQRLKCPTRVKRSSPPVTTTPHSVYQDILTPPVLSHKAGLQSDLFPNTFVKSRVIPPMPYCYQMNQVETEDAFDFDVEVEPFLEVLVGVSVTDAMHDAVAEHELDVEQAARDHFRSHVTAEREYLECLRAEDSRRRGEKERRAEQFVIGCQSQIERALAVAPLRRVKGGEGDLSTVDNTLQGLRLEPYTHDVNKREIETNLVPCLRHEVAMTSSDKEATRGLLTDMIRDVTTALSRRHDVSSSNSSDSGGVLKDDEEWQITCDDVSPRHAAVTSEKGEEQVTSDTLSQFSCYARSVSELLEGNNMSPSTSVDTDKVKQEDASSDATSTDGNVSWAGVIQNYW